jgi:DNA-binding transcriptional LysR family regulator
MLEADPFDSRVGRRLRLQDLHVLSAVVQWGSMAKAAARLGLSQPSVSEAIAKLEDALRVRLLDRSPRGVEPTIYAEALLKRSVVVFDELKQGIRDIAFLADPTVGEVRIGCPENLTAGFVPEVIERLSRRYPKIQVHVMISETSATELRDLRQRNVDLMLGRVFNLPADDDVNTEVLWEDEFFVVAGSHSPWASRRKIALAELVDELWVSLPSNNAPAQFYAEAFQAQGLPVPRESVTTFSLHVRLHLLASGRFLTILPASVLRTNADRWSLVALPVDLRLKKRQFAVFTLKNRTASPTIQLFIEQVRAVAQSMLNPTVKASALRG